MANKRLHVGKYLSKYYTREYIGNSFSLGEPCFYDDRTSLKEHLEGLGPNVEICLGEGLKGRDVSYLIKKRNKAS